MLIHWATQPTLHPTHVHTPAPKPANSATTLREPAAEAVDSGPMPSSTKRPWLRKPASTRNAAAMPPACSNRVRCCCCCCATAAAWSRCRCCAAAACCCCCAADAGVLEDAWLPLAALSITAKGSLWGPGAQGPSTSAAECRAACSSRPLRADTQRPWPWLACEHRAQGMEKESVQGAVGRGGLLPAQSSHAHSAKKQPQAAKAHALSTHLLRRECVASAAATPSRAAPAPQWGASGDPKDSWASAPVRADSRYTSEKVP